MGPFSPTALYQSLLDDTSKYADLYGPPTEKELSKWIACQALRESFYKKFVDSKAPDADAKAFDLFKESNQRCADWTYPAGAEDQIFLNEFKRSLEKFWYKNGYSMVHSHHDIFNRGKFGSGSTISCVLATAYTKLFASKLSTSSSTLYQLYSDNISQLPMWKAAEEMRRLTHGDATIVEGNRLSFVPKTDSISRCICTEPTLNNFYQLGFGLLLLDRLKEVFNIDLSTQPDHNREMARLGSIDGSFGTIDLKSASDTISCKMVSAVFPKPWITWLRLLRSPNCMTSEGLVQMEMISSMGNGFTFPLQTIIFTCALATVYYLKGIPIIRNANGKHGNFGVFGDDIVCRSDCFDDLCHYLTLLGFQVNSSKSFNKGSFRESCGHDYHLGQNVRGVYIKHIRTLQDFFKAINRLNDWTSRTGIPLTKTVRFLHDRTGDKFVPLCENDDSGVKVPDMLVKRRLFDRNTGSRRYRRSISRPGQAIVYDGHILAPKRRSVEFNLYGLALAHLGGFIREHKMLLRLEFVSYATKWSITPNWDYEPPVHREYRWFRTVSLKTACVMNMLSPD